MHYKIGYDNRGRMHNIKNCKGKYEIKLNQTTIWPSQRNKQAISESMYPYLKSLCFDWPGNCLRAVLRELCFPQALFAGANVTAGTCLGRGWAQLEGRLAEFCPNMYIGKGWESGGLMWGGIRERTVWVERGKPAHRHHNGSLAFPLLYPWHFESFYFTCQLRT